jgi:hypothetical protein
MLTHYLIDLKITNLYGIKKRTDALSLCAIIKDYPHVDNNTRKHDTLAEQVPRKPHFYSNPYHRY